MQEQYNIAVENLKTLKNLLLDTAKQLELRSKTQADEIRRTNSERIW